MFLANDCIADGDLATKFSNQSSIANTRHNLTQRQASGGGPNGAIMDPYRNDYGQVCVYCHTPHGANSNAAMPLWNRAIANTTYTTYDQLGTSSLSGTVSQPGAASLSCLSCHNGLQSVDAIINMPGPGRYSANPDNAFLSTWSNPSGVGPYVHAGLRQGECLACHSPEVGVVGAGATDFTTGAIGTDLRSIHPIGVAFPAENGDGTDWKAPRGSTTVGGRTTRYFDDNGNGRMDTVEIRLYGSDNGPSVECSSCHDPHGVASGGLTFNATFLRKPAAQVCMTCHNL